MCMRGLDFRTSLKKISMYVCVCVCVIENCIYNISIRGGIRLSDI